MTTQPKPDTERRGWLVSRASTNLSITLPTTQRRACARLRRASPFVHAPVLVPRAGKVDVAATLNMSSAEAVQLIDASEEVQRLVRRGLLEVQ